jgi:hypothetical protein
MSARRPRVEVERASSSRTLLGCALRQAKPNSTQRVDRTDREPMTGVKSRARVVSKMCRGLAPESAAGSAAIPG